MFILSAPRIDREQIHTDSFAQNPMYSLSLSVSFLRPSSKPVWVSLFSLLDYKLSPESTSNCTWFYGFYQQCKTGNLLKVDVSLQVTAVCPRHFFRHRADDWHFDELANGAELLEPMVEASLLMNHKTIGFDGEKSKGMDRTARTVSAKFHALGTDYVSRIKAV